MWCQHAHEKRTHKMKDSQIDGTIVLPLAHTHTQLRLHDDDDEDEVRDVYTYNHWKHFRITFRSLVARVLESKINKTVWKHFCIYIAVRWLLMWCAQFILCTFIIIIIQIRIENGVHVPLPTVDTDRNTHKYRYVSLVPLLICQRNQPFRRKLLLCHNVTMCNMPFFWTETGMEIGRGKVERGGTETVELWFAGCYQTTVCCHMNV